MLSHLENKHGEEIVGTRAERSIVVDFESFTRD